MSSSSSSSLPPLPIEEDMARAGIYPVIPLRDRMAMHFLYERVRALTEQVEQLMSATNNLKAPGKLLADKDVVAVHADLQGVGTECPICLHPFCPEQSPVVALRSCGHSFHHTCISKWVLCASTCPICRKDV